MESTTSHNTSHANSAIKSSTAAAFPLVNVSVSVRSGESVALVGAVGAGKTSFLMALLGE
jgi:ABC-type branched-subunit amino acid transport system ATPase component